MVLCCIHFHISRCWNVEWIFWSLVVVSWHCLEVKVVFFCIRSPCARGAFQHWMEDSGYCWHNMPPNHLHDNSCHFLGEEEAPNHLLQKRCVVSRFVLYWFHRGKISVSLNIWCEGNYNQILAKVHCWIGIFVTVANLHCTFLPKVSHAHYVVVVVDTVIGTHLYCTVLCRSRDWAAFVPASRYLLYFSIRQWVGTWDEEEAVA